MYIFTIILFFHPSIHPSPKHRQWVQNEITDYNEVQNCYGEIQGYGWALSTALLLPTGSEAILIKVTYYRHKCEARERFIKADVRRVGEKQTLPLCPDVLSLALQNPAICILNPAFQLRTRCLWMPVGKSALEGCLQRQHLLVEAIVTWFPMRRSVKKKHSVKY